MMVRRIRRAISKAVVVVNHRVVDVRRNLFAIFIANALFDADIFE
jgi:hypothetical protein